MRLVFDTNVLFAAQITRGACTTLYQKALTTETLLTSGAILDELEAKLVAKAGLDPEQAARTRAEVAQDCCSVVISPLRKPVCRDADVCLHESVILSEFPSLGLIRFDLHGRTPLEGCCHPRVERAPNRIRPRIHKNRFVLVCFSLFLKARRRSRAWARHPSQHMGRVRYPIRGRCPLRTGRNARAA